jgi:hypothetical protein
MGVLDAGVDDVGAGTCAARVVVDVVGRAAGTVRNTSQTPRSTRLGDVGIERNSGVLLNVVDLEGD